MSTLRPMESRDVATAEIVWSDAYPTMRASYSMPVDPRTPESIERMQSRVAHLLASDPQGSWVAEDDAGEVVGFAQALVRDGFWVLALLGVSTRSQERGTGTALLGKALAYGSTSMPGLIMSSRDPRAMRAYSRAGFDLRPAIVARGQVDHQRVKPSGRVRPGSSRDFDFIATLDRHARGGDRLPDIEDLLDNGCQLLVIDGEGFVLASGGRPVMLAGANSSAASELLSTCLAQATDDVIEVGWITSEQQWAITTSLDAGLTLHPSGPVMTRGLAAMPSFYLPSGMHG